MDAKQVASSEQRQNGRTKVSIAEDLWVLVTSPRFTGEFLVVDYSPFGIGVVTERDENEIPLKQGDPVTVLLDEVFTALPQEARVASVSQMVWRGKFFQRLGLQFSSSRQNLADFRVVKRRKRRFSNMRLPFMNCVALDPMRAGHKMLFTVKDIGREGIALVTSAQYRFLMVGTRLQLTMTIPSQGTFRVDVSVRYVREERASYFIGCRFEKPSVEFLRAIGQFFSQTPHDVTIRDLQDDNFPLSYLGHIIQVKNVLDPREFTDALRLRALHAQGTPSKMPPALFNPQADKIDRYARQIAVKLGDRMIAAARISFHHTSVPKPSEILRQEIPYLASLLKGSRFAELSKLSIHPDFRSAGIAVSLFAEIVNVVTLEELEFILTVVPSSLVSHYEHYGFRIHAAEGHHRKLDHVLMYVKISDLVAGHGLDFMTWYFLMAPTINRARKAPCALAVGRWTRAKLRLGQILSPWFERKIEMALR